MSSIPKSHPYTSTHASPYLIRTLDPDTTTTAASAFHKRPHAS